MEDERRIIAEREEQARIIELEQARRDEESRLALREADIRA